MVQKSESAGERFDVEDRMEAIEGIKQGLESMKRNAGKPAEEFFQEILATDDTDDTD